MLTKAAANLADRLSGATVYNKNQHGKYKQTKKYIIGTDVAQRITSIDDTLLILNRKSTMKNLSAKTKQIVAAAIFCVLTLTSLVSAGETETKRKVSGKNVEKVKTETTKKARYFVSPEEDSLMQAIMKQVSIDRHTKDVAIAIDDFKAGDGNQFKGVGTVRVGGAWKNFNFTVAFEDDNQTAKKVVYKIQ